MALAIVLRVTRLDFLRSRWNRGVSVIGRLAISAWRCMYTSALSSKPRARQIALAVSCTCATFEGWQNRPSWWYMLTSVPPVSIVSAAADQSRAFLATSGMTAAILLFAFCVARTWLAATTVRVALGSRTYTPIVSRKGLPYCRAGCIRSPTSAPICHRA